jgi:hypothetical protein
MAADRDVRQGEKKPSRRARATTGAASPSDTSPRDKELRSIDEVGQDEILTAMRGAANMDPCDEGELMRRVGKMLGFPRVGSRVQARLKRELRVAIRRRILARDGLLVRCAVLSKVSYDMSSLVAALAPAMKGEQGIQSELELAIVRQLGFGAKQGPANDAISIRLPERDVPAIQVGANAKRRR